MANTKHERVPRLSTLSTIIRRRKELDEQLVMVENAVSGKVGKQFLKVFGDVYPTANVKKQNAFLNDLRDTADLFNEYFGDIYPAYDDKSLGSDRRAFMERVRGIYDQHLKEESGSILADVLAESNHADYSTGYSQSNDMVGVTDSF